VIYPDWLKCLHIFTPIITNWMIWRTGGRGRQILYIILFVCGLFSILYLVFYFQSSSTPKNMIRLEKHQIAVPTVPIDKPLKLKTKGHQQIPPSRWPTPPKKYHGFPRKTDVAHRTSKKRIFSMEPDPKRSHVFMIWLGASFPPFYQRCVETVLFHHPQAQVLVYSNELPLDYKFRPEVTRNHSSFHIVRWDESEFFGREAGSMFAVQKSDFLRLYLVYNYGGIYVDTDILVLRSLSLQSNYIGVNTQRSFYNCTNNAVIKGDTTVSCLCTCIFSFDQYHPFMGEALANYYKFWSLDKRGYSPGGAVMLMTMLDKYKEHINFIDTLDLFCYRSRDKFNLEVTTNTDPTILDFQSRCHTLHVFGAGASVSPIEISKDSKSVIARLWKMNTGAK
jgi:hypothetical protein